MIRRFAWTLLVVACLAAAGCGGGTRRFASDGEAPSDADLRLVGVSVADEIAERSLVPAGGGVAQGRIVVRADGQMVRAAVLVDAASRRLQEAHGIALGGVHDWRLEGEIAISDRPPVSAADEVQEWRVVTRLAMEGRVVLLDERVIAKRHPRQARWK